MGAFVSSKLTMEIEHVTRNKSHVPIFVVFCVSCVDLAEHAGEDNQRVAHHISQYQD